MIHIKGAVEKYEIRYKQVYEWQPAEIIVVPVNFISTESAREYIERFLSASSIIWTKIYKIN